MSNKKQNKQAKPKRQRPQQQHAPRPVIFSTGVYLIPKRVMLDGKLQWGWVVTEFEGDSFLNGDVFNPPETAPRLSKLLEEAIEL